MRTLTVLADGASFAPGCRFHLSGKATLSLFPDLFLLECRNLKESDVICLPRKDKLKCRAYLIVKEAVPEIEEKELLGFEFEMIKDSENDW